MSRKNNSLNEKILENKFIELISKPTDFYIERILQKNKEFDFKKPVVLFGAAKMGVLYSKLCKKNKIKILSFCDNDESKYNFLTEGLKVISPKMLENEFKKETQIIISSSYDDEIKKQLNKMGFKNVWSHIFFSTVFNKKFDAVPWANEISRIFLQKDDLLKCFRFLNDSLSKKVFLNVIRYRLSLDRKCLKSIESNVDEIYFDKQIYSVSENEIFVDGGAFDGDTVKLFIEKTGNKFKQIYCFEPDSRSYLDLKNYIKKKNDKRIKIFKYGLGSEKKEVFFTNDGSLGSKISDSGEKIKIVSVDNFIKNKVTLLKLDIEGYEKNVLIGSKKNILKNKTKLAVCTYHKIADIWEIPLLIKKINPNYKIYMRHYSQFLLDTICYGIPNNL